MAQFAPQYNLFAIVDKVRTVLTIIFWTVFGFSVVPVIMKLTGVKFDIDDLVNQLNIVGLALFFILEILVDYILVPLADSHRRDDMLDNSFGSKFTSKSSVGYFDTDAVPVGTYRAACNLFANCFFTYSLVKITTVQKVIKPAIVLLSIGVCAYYGFREVPFALSLLQVLFSATILGELIKHCILLVRLQNIENAWKDLFQQTDFKLDPEKYEPFVYRYWLQYETLHSRIQTNIPSKIFHKMNDRLTIEWGLIKVRYGIG